MTEMMRAVDAPRTSPAPVSHYLKLKTDASAAL